MVGDVYWAWITAQAFGQIELFFLAQSDFGVGLIQLTLNIPRNPTFVLNSKFPGSLCHPLTKRPGFFYFKSRFGFRKALIVAKVRPPTADEGAESILLRS